jgi:DNA-binding CsgD family transcriptional regulator
MSPTMSSTVNGNQSPGPFERCAGVAERIGLLPAVATLDWPDLAAACMARVVGPSRAVVMLASLHADGGVAGHEATGVASFGVTGENPADRQQGELTLRSRCERLSELGFRPGTLEAQGRWGGLANEVVQGPTWRDTALGRTWAGMDVSDLVVGAARVCATDASRYVIVQVAALGTPEARPRMGSEEAAILNALMPVLARRTLIAVGPEKTTAARWLTAREQEVLGELTLGKSVREIAEVIDRSPHTVHDHVKSLHKKLSAKSRGELVARALGRTLDSRPAAVGAMDGLSIETGAAKPGGGRGLDPSLADAVRGEATPPVDRAEPKPDPRADGKPGLATKLKTDGLDTTIG